jgi:hypothetical protein
MLHICTTMGQMFRRLLATHWQIFHAVTVDIGNSLTSLLQGEFLIRHCQLLQLALVRGLPKHLRSFSRKYCLSCDAFDKGYWITVSLEAFL